MREGLPRGWIEVKLGDVSTKPQYGWTCSAAKNGDVKLLRTTDISDGSVQWEKVPFCSKNPDDLDKYLIKADDILVSRAGSIGISYRIKDKDLKFDTVFASYLIRFRPIIDTSYIEYFFKSHLYWDYIFGSKSGIAIPNVNATKLQELKIPLPPLNEQKRIAEKLNHIMPKIDRVKERLERIPKIIKRFRQSVLTAAVTGKLTNKWREEHPEVESAKVLLDRIKKERERKYQEECEKDKKEGIRKTKQYLRNSNRVINIEIPNSWETVSTSYLFYYVTSGSRGWAKYYSENGAIFIRITNLSYNHIEMDLSHGKIQRVELPQNVEGKRTKVSPGDFLFSITGDVGMIAIVPENITEAYVNQHIALARPIDVFFKKFLGYFFQSQSGGLNQLKALQKGVTKAGLSLDDIINIIVPLPPLEEQREIVRQVDRLFVFADKLEEHYKKAKEKIDKLPQSVLAKAFRGELVPQDPNDEPAEKLLERIKEEKEKLQAARPGKKRNSPRRHNE